MATTNTNFTLTLDIPAPLDASGKPTGLDINRSVPVVIASAIRRAGTVTFTSPGNSIVLTTQLGTGLGIGPQFIFISSTGAITISQTIAILGTVVFNCQMFLWTQPPAGNACTALTLSALAASVPCDVEWIICGSL